MPKLQPPPINEISSQFPRFAGWLRDVWKRGFSSSVGGNVGSVIKLDADGNLVDSEISMGDDYITIGNSTTDGSWKIQIINDTLEIQRRESNVWVKKGAFKSS